jgi:methylthioribose-1-phosphate isomerase
VKDPATDDVLTPLRWQDGALHLLDQRFLPAEEVWLRYDEEEGVAQAIRDMVVRGAPAIGCTAAYGVALAARRRAATDPTRQAADLAARLAAVERDPDALVITSEGGVALRTADEGDADASSVSAGAPVHAAEDAAELAAAA